MSTILLVDATNLFIRHYVAKPSLDLNGKPNGGVLGFLQNLSYFIRFMAADRVVLAWDGPGGSVKRRAINENYKKSRKPPRLNRNYDLDEDDEITNKIEQRLRLGEYIKNLPMSEIIVPDIEADDVIAYLSEYFTDDNIIIISNDQDFYQLVNERIKVYGHTKRKFFSIKDVYNEFQIYPRNFALAKAIVGDKSDNLAGIYGIGFTRLVKYFPFLSEDRDVTFEEIFEHSKNSDKKYKKILEGKNIVLANYKIMQLKTPIISFPSVSKIKDSLQRRLSFSPTLLRIKMLQDGITDLNDGWFQPFRILEVKGKQYGVNS